MANVYTLSSPVDLSQTISTTKPTTRVNGSALVVGDIWQNLTDRVLCFWDGTQWLGASSIVDSFSEANGAGGTFPSPVVSISQDTGKSIWVESFTVSYQSFGSNPLTDFVLLELQTYRSRITGRTAIGSISTANATAERKVTAQIGQAFTVGIVAPAISLFAIGSVYGGGGGASCFWQGAVAYRRIY